MRGNYPQPHKQPLATCHRRCHHRGWGTVLSRCGTRAGNREGCQIFVDVLTQFAEQNRIPRLTPIIRRAGSPLHVAVRGRSGVGCATVSAALTDAGVAVTTDAAAADVSVLVIAETLKPEDRAIVMQSDRPTVVVLNKADLSGFGAAGPLALAHRRAADIRAATGSPTVAMVGLLAIAELDDELLGALQTLVRAPADLTSTDAFVASDHPLQREVRQRLLDNLDRFGIASAVLAIGDGADAAAVLAQLRRLSLVDRVVAQLDAAGAPVRYRRVRAAVVELHALAARSGNRELAEFLAGDDTVLAVMAAAVDVVEAEGMHVDAGDDPAAHRLRAVHWRRYGQGPVNALHRSCSADICRGSLRLLGRCR